jgi:DNA-binding XRE family transcriptional regulator
MISVFDVPEIRVMRKKLGVTQDKMAQVLKISLSTYQKYERGSDMPISRVKKCTEYILALEEVEKKISG